MKNLTLGLSEFACPAPRVGSIEALSGFGPALEEGVEWHQQIQAERAREFPEFMAEKWIAQVFTRGDYRITVNGRLDGFYARAVPRIEEIKSTFDIEKLERVLRDNPEHPYCLQLRTYGYLHYLHTGQMAELYFHLISTRTKKSVEFSLALDLPNYEAWLERRLKEIVEETQMFEKLRKRRRALSLKFIFPFPAPRPGQMELMETIQSRLKGKSKLLLQAPTGLGKTAGVLFPTMKEALARGQKVLYLTPKNSQHAVAEDAVQRLQKAGLRIKSVTLNAKAKMCMKDEPLCDPRHCEYADRHFTKISENGLIEKLAKKKNLTAKTFRQFAETHQVCPFELQFQILPRADVVIGDYNYVFAPHHSTGRLSYNGLDDKSAPNLVIDEAHNLPDRARDYFGAKVSTFELARFQSATSHLPHDLREEWSDILQDARQLIVTAGAAAPSAPHVVTLERERFQDLNARLQEFQGHYLAETPHVVSDDAVLRFSYLWGEFTTALEWEGDTFVTTFTPEAASGGQLKVTCYDASAWLRERYKDFSHVVGFSATLKPFDYHLKILGLEDGTETAEFESPFPKAHRKLMIIPQVSTKYHDRTREVPKIKSAIERIVRLHPGNYFVFFPSFAFLNQVAKTLELDDFDLLLQQPEMRKPAIEKYLARLREPERPTLLLAVQGGVFAEGVDYPGDMAIGALIVGPGLPAFDFERELLRAYFDKVHGHGFEYAYAYPAMTRVIQSAGRVIRSPEDRGLIVLMDRRFLQSSYSEAMPVDWHEGDARGLVSQEILKDISEFWRPHET